MNFTDIVQSRYAVKSFDGQKVSSEQLEALLELIRHTPTSFNVQPWRAIVIEDDERKQALLESSWNQPSITSCSHLFVFCANTDLSGLTDRLAKRVAEAGTPPEKVDAYINVVREFIDALPDKLAWAQRQTYIALAHGILGARSLGLDSCPMEGFLPDQYSRILDLPETSCPQY